MGLRRSQREGEDFRQREAAFPPIGPGTFQHQKTLR